MNIFLLLRTVIVASLLATGAFAASIGDYYLISTTINGAQTQIDVDHSSIWFFTPTADFSLIGGSFVMKDGPNSSAPVLLTLYQGVPAGGITMASVELTNAPFTQSFNPVLFQFASTQSLLQGQSYTLVLNSSAPDVQSRAYFIKGSSDVGFSTTTSSQNVQSITGPIINQIGDPQSLQEPPPPAAVPEPGTYLLTASAIAMLLGARRHRS